MSYLFDKFTNHVNEFKTGKIYKCLINDDFSKQNHENEYKIAQARGLRRYYEIAKSKSRIGVISGGIAFASMTAIGVTALEKDCGNSNRAHVNEKDSGIPSPIVPNTTECDKKNFAVYEFGNTRGMVTSDWLWLLSEARKMGWNGSLKGPVSGMRTYEMQKKLYDCYRDKKNCNGAPAFDPNGPNRSNAMHLLNNVYREGEWRQAVDVHEPNQLIKIAGQLGVDLYQPYIDRETWHLEAKNPFKAPNTFKCPKPIFVFAKGNDNLPDANPVPSSPVPTNPQDAGSDIHVEKAPNIEFPQFDVVAEAKKAREALVDIKTNNKLWKQNRDINDFDVLIAARSNDSKKLQYITVRPGGASSKGFVVKKENSNGVNTSFKIDEPDGYFTLAIKKVIRGKSPKKFREVVYTPYSLKLDIPDVSKSGLAYLKELIQYGKKTLRKKGIQSKAIPQVLTADVVPEDIMLALTIIEHIDYLDLNTEPMNKLVMRVLSTISLNRNLAYDYSVSSVGARGLFQFMPSTYQGIRKNYPKASLDVDTVSGLNNEFNGVQAQMLLILIYYIIKIIFLGPKVRTICCHEMTHRDFFQRADFYCGFFHRALSEVDPRDRGEVTLAGSGALQVVAVGAP